MLDAIPAGRPVSVERETFPGLLESGRRLQAHVESSYWLDLGTPASFVRGSADLVQGAAPTAALPGPVGTALLLAGAKVAPSASLTDGTTVGADVQIGDGSRVSGSVLMDGARIGDGALIERSVIGPGASIGDDTVVRDAVVGDGASIGASCELLAGRARLARTRRPGRRSAILGWCLRSSLPPRNGCGGRSSSSTCGRCSRRCAAGGATRPSTWSWRGPRGGEIWRSTPTPDGPATLAISRRDGEVRARAWGPGAQWAVDGVPMLLGAEDDDSGFVGHHPLVAETRRRMPGLRLGGTRTVWDLLVPSILEQKVTGTEARRSWRELCWRFGEDAAGPLPAPDEAPADAAAAARDSRLGVAPRGRRPVAAPGDPRVARRSPTAWRRPPSCAARPGARC